MLRCRLAGTLHRPGSTPPTRADIKPLI